MEIQGDKLYYTPREVAHELSISDDAVLDLINKTGPARSACVPQDHPQ
jgi:hypothetical protein